MNKRLIISIVVLAALIFVLSSYQSTQMQSGVRGVVRLGPTCPVTKTNQDDPNCADKLFETSLELVRFNTLEVVKKFSSNKNGEFEIRVPAGEYTIRSVSKDLEGMCGKSGLVPVEGGQFTEVIVFCDTGIR